ncbi:MAG: hypothetical protein IJU57_00495 [Clostridia bacterium]|nr:hypothetical protein [Clostridia bacterium]
MTALVLKLIAAFSMLCDHACIMVFPQLSFLRIIGRLAFPIYAFFIAEGFLHTRNRLKYFLRIFVFGILCQIVFFIVERRMYLGVLITFSISIILMWLYERARNSIASSLSGEKRSPAVRDGAFFVLGAALSFLLCRFVEVDYGFIGIMIPVCTSISKDRKIRLLGFGTCLCALCIYECVAHKSFIQLASLAALPLLALYNGETGTRPGSRFKYFFYIFYAAHFIVLYLLSLII